MQSINFHLVKICCYNLTGKYSGLKIDEVKLSLLLMSKGHKKAPHCL